MPGGIGRGPRHDNRQRREFQKLGAQGIGDTEAPIVWDEEDGTLGFDIGTLAAITDPQLTDQLVIDDASATEPQARRVTLAEIIADLIWRTGDIKPTLEAGAPSGWLVLNGDTIGNTGSGADHAGPEYANLYAIVRLLAPNAGTESFAGGDPVTLPDARRRTLIGAGGTIVVGSADGGVDDAIGDTGGVEEHTLTLGQMPVHDHDYFYNAASVATTGTASRAHGTFQTPATTGQAGGGEAHNTIQPSLVVNYLVRI